MPAQTPKPEGQESLLNAKPESKVPAQTPKPEVQGSLLNAKPESKVPAQTPKPEVQESLLNAKPESKVPAQTPKPEGQEPLPNAKPESKEPAQTAKPEGQESPKNAQPENKVTAPTTEPEVQELPLANKPADQDVCVPSDSADDGVRLHRVALDTESSPEARKALLKSAHSTAAFRHPWVLAVRDVRLEGDSLVFVQDRPQGPPLADTLAQGGRVPLAEALKWIHQIASALEAARASGLTLSQIAPTEFVVQEATASEASGGLLCLCPPVPAGWWLEVEDPVFASPEQKDGRACDIRSTMYSTGAVLAAMVTGQRPAGANSWNSVIATAKLPLGVTRALKAVLEVEPGKRCANPADWMALLEMAMAAPPLPGKGSAGATPAKKTTSPSSLVGMGEAIFVTPAGNKVRRALSPSMVAIVVVILAIGVWLFSPKKAPSPEPAPAHLAPPASEASHSPPADAAPPKKAAPTPTPSTTAPKNSPQPPPTPAPRAEPKSSAAAGSPSAAIPEASPKPPPTPAPRAEPKNSAAGSPSAAIPEASPKPPATPTPHPESKNSVAAAAPHPAALPEAGPKPTVILPPMVSKLTPVAAVPPSPEPAKLEAKVTPPTKPAAMPAVAEVKPAPSSSIPSAPVPPSTTESKPKPASKDDLLRQAAQTSGSARSELYRKVLAMDSRNAQALHGLVEGALADLPAPGAQRDEITLWADELIATDDPLGTHALGCIALQQSADAHNLTASIKSISDAVTKFKHSLHSGYSNSYVQLVQAYVSLHSVQLKNREKPKADRTSRAVQDEIDNMPDTVPAKDSRDLAMRLETQMKDHSSKGPSRMQEAFLKTVVQHLYSMAAKRGDEPSQKWVKTHS